MSSGSPQSSTRELAHVAQQRPSLRAVTQDMVSSGTVHHCTVCKLEEQPENTSHTEAPPSSNWLPSQHSYGLSQALIAPEHPCFCKASASSTCGHAWWCSMMHAYHTTIVLDIQLEAPVSGGMPTNHGSSLGMPAANGSTASVGRPQAVGGPAEDC